MLSVVSSWLCAPIYMLWNVCIWRVSTHERMICADSSSITLSLVSEQARKKFQDWLFGARKFAYSSPLSSTWQDRHRQAVNIHKWYLTSTLETFCAFLFLRIDSNSLRKLRSGFGFAQRTEAAHSSELRRENVMKNWNFAKTGNAVERALDCLCVKISTEKLRISIPFKRSGALEERRFLAESHSETIELIFSTLLASASIYMFSISWKCCDPLEEYHESIDDKVAIDLIINQETRHTRVGIKLSES